MFPFIIARANRAADDMVIFCRRHIPGFVLTLLAGAVALPLVKFVAGADMKQEAVLLVLYGLVGPLAVLGFAFGYFWWRASGKIYDEQTGEIAHLKASQSAAPEHPGKRDVSVAEAVAFIAYGAWGKKFSEAASSHDVDAVWALKQFRQAAADGNISVWGIGDGRVYEPIPKEFWLKNEIEWFELLKGTPHTQPTNSRERNPQRYLQLMTSRSDTERLHRNQPQEVLRAKLAARSLAGLVTEAVAERNKLLHVTEDFNAQASEAVVVAWDKRVLAKLDETSISEGERSRFETLDTFHPELFGDEDRPDEQKRLEAIWNKKIQILRTIVDEIGR